MGEITAQQVINLITETARETFSVPDITVIEETTTVSDLVDISEADAGTIGQVQALPSALSEALEEQYNIAVEVAGYMNLHTMSHEEIRALNVVEIAYIVIKSLEAEGY